MLARLFTRLIDANGFWARPLGDFYVRILRAILQPIWPVKDFLNGKWLGHSLHSAITDAALGGLLSVSLLDVLGYPDAARVLLGVAILTMVAAAVAGFADYTDTDGLARQRATVHNTVMIVALIVYVASFVIRLNEVGSSTAIILGLVGALLITIGGYIGGEIVYGVGNMVDRHAWRRGPSEWTRLQIGDLVEATPTRGMAGEHPVLVVRYGSTVYAMDDICAHAGGILSDGKIVDGKIECPLHGSRYELKSGYRKRGPTTFDQPWHEIRSASGGGYEIRLGRGH